MKTNLLLIILAVCFSYCINTNAQPTIQWQNTIGGSDVDQLYSIQQTSDGGYVLGGLSKSNVSGDKTENSQGLSDYWVVKLDSLGVIQWQNTIGGSDDDWLYSIQQTSDGGYVLGGTSISDISGDKTENSQGDRDYWVVKLDSLGSIQWQNTIGGSLGDYLESIQQTSDGGYVLGGWSNSPISGDKTENNLGPSGTYDYWVVKLNTTGAIQWQNTIGGSSSDKLYSIQQTSDEGYILGGYSYSDSTGDKTENNQGIPGVNTDYWVVKLDTTGTIQWQNTIGGSGNDQLYSIQQTSDGGYVLGGHSLSSISGDKTENSQGVQDYWVVKLDTTGTIQWQNTIGGNGHDELYSIQQTSDDGYVLGGYSLSNISGDKTENSQGVQDYWVVKLDTMGTIQWQNTIGGTNYDVLESIQQTSDGGYILGGYSLSNASGDKTENSQGGIDYWVVKLLCGAAITDPDISICNGDSISIYGTFRNVAGTYYDSLLNVNGCDSVHSTVLTVDQLPTVNLGADTIICNGCSITLDAGAGFANYNWPTGDTTQTIIVDSSGTYTVQVTDANGCVGGDTIVLDIVSGTNQSAIDNRQSIIVNPNPNTGQFTLLMLPEVVMTETSVCLYNVLGEAIYKNDKINKSYLKFDISDHSKGIYFVKVIKGKDLFVAKVIYQ